MKCFASLLAAFAAVASISSTAEAQVLGKGGKGQAAGQKLNQAFEAGDANKDGFLDRKEFLTALHSLFPHHQSKGASGQKPAAAAAKGAAAGKANGAQQQHKHHPFEDADTNKDGKVSKAEFAAFVQHKIQQMRQKAASGKTAGTASRRPR